MSNNSIKNICKQCKSSTSLSSECTSCAKNKEDTTVRMNDTKSVNKITQTQHEEGKNTDEQNVKENKKNSATDSTNENIKCNAGARTSGDIKNSTSSNNKHNYNTKSDKTYSAKSLDNLDVQNLSQNDQIENSSYDDFDFFDSTESFDLKRKDLINDNGQILQGDDLLNESSNLFSSEEEEDQRTRDLKVLGKIFTATEKPRSSFDKKNNDKSIKSKSSVSNVKNIEHEKPLLETKEKSSDVKNSDVNNSETNLSDVKNSNVSYTTNDEDTDKESQNMKVDVIEGRKCKKENINIESDKENLEIDNQNSIDLRSVKKSLEKAVNSQNKNNQDYSLAKNLPQSQELSSSFTQMISKNTFNNATTPKNTPKNILDVKNDTKSSPKNILCVDNKDKLIKSQNDMNAEKEHALMYELSKTTPTSNNMAKEDGTERNTKVNYNNKNEKNYKKSETITTNTMNDYLGLTNKNSESNKDSTYVNTYNNFSNCVVCNSIKSYISNIDENCALCSDCQMKYKNTLSSTSVTSLQNSSTNKESEINTENKTFDSESSTPSQNYSSDANNNKEVDKIDSCILERVILQKQNNVGLSHTNKKIENVFDLTQNSSSLIIDELNLRRFGEINQLTGNLDQDIEETNEHFPISLETPNRRDKNKNQNKLESEDQLSALGSPIQIDSTTGVRRGSVKKLIGYFESITKKDTEN